MSDASPPSPDILLCPGQGAQHVGMGRAWCDRFPVAAQTFAAADRALGFELSKVCFTGPQERLNRTDVAQAAIFVTSVACFQALIEAGRIGRIAATAGLSLGEFTALHLAGAFDFATGLRLVRLRGQAMQEAAEAVPSGMVALIGADETQANEVCAASLEAAPAGEVLVPANFNCPGQIVLSGSRAACERAVGVAEAKGVRATPLQVAGAFHSPLMTPAAERLAAALDEAEWVKPTATVLSNVTAEPHDPEPAAIRARLVAQLTRPVRWEESMRWLLAHVPGRLVELAPGKTLSGMMRRIDRGAKVENFAEPPAA